MNITAEFYLRSMIHSRDKEHHNINIETSLAVRIYEHTHILNTYLFNKRNLLKHEHLFYFTFLHVQ